MVMRGRVGSESGEGGGVKGEGIDAQQMGIAVLVLAEDIGYPLSDGGPLVHALLSLCVSEG